MKVLTILGTRPEIIRLSMILKKLDRLCNHKILHTGQNYDSRLNDIFFKDLGLRNPDVVIDSKSSSLSEQISKIMIGTENYIKSFHPDKVLILGDTNSGLAAIIAERLGIPVYHMEAGNRCYDSKVPEEKNRKLIDAISTFNLPYTPGSRENLLKEGHHKSNVIMTGNPILEVLMEYKEHTEESNILNTLNISKQNYVLVTAHRAENVDIENRIVNIFAALIQISKSTPVIFSCHPRTKTKMEKYSIYAGNIKICEPFGFFDFLHLEKNAKCVISDSGTVQEECCIFGVPTVTIRDSTERPETVECGSNIISGLEKENIINCFNYMTSKTPNWKLPNGYDTSNVSDIISSILLGKQK